MARYMIEKNELVSFLSYCESQGCSVQQGSFNNPYQVAMIEKLESRENGANEFAFIYRRDKTNRLTVDKRIVDLLIAYKDIKQAKEEFKNG